MREENEHHLWRVHLFSWPTLSHRQTDTFFFCLGVEWRRRRRRARNYVVAFVLLDECAVLCCRLLNVNVLQLAICIAGPGRASGSRLSGHLGGGRRGVLFECITWWVSRTTQYVRTVTYSLFGSPLCPFLVPKEKKKWITLLGVTKTKKQISFFLVVLSRPSSSCKCDLHFRVKETRNKDNKSIVYWWAKREGRRVPYWMEAIWNLWWRPHQTLPSFAPIRLLLSFIGKQIRTKYHFSLL